MKGSQFKLAELKASCGIKADVEFKCALGKNTGN